MVVCRACCGRIVSPYDRRMGELELHVACKKCGRIRIMRPDEVLPFEHHRLKCSHCGSRDPEVREQERIAPFQKGYKPWTGKE